MGENFAKSMGEKNMDENFVKNMGERSMVENFVKQEALWATYLTGRSGASGQKGENNYSRKDGCRKVTVPLNVSLK